MEFFFFNTVNQCWHILMSSLPKHSKENQELMKCLYLRDEGGLVDIWTVAPSIQTVLLLQLCDIHIYAWNDSLGRQISDHVQSVPTTTAAYLFAMHHLSRTVTNSSFVTSLCRQILPVAIKLCLKKPNNCSFNYKLYYSESVATLRTAYSTMVYSNYYLEN